MKTHSEDPFAARFGAAEFRIRQIRQGDDSLEPAAPYEHCSYCGSISIDQAIKALQTPGTRYSGSDWKYGWPHKFYIEIPCEPFKAVTMSHYDGQGNRTHQYGEKSKRYEKFYSEHLLDATPEQLKQWNAIATPLLGVEFEIVNDRLRWKAVPGYQASGTVGA